MSSSNGDLITITGQNVDAQTDRLREIMGMLELEHLTFLSHIVFTASIKAACDKAGIKPATYSNWPDDVKSLIKEAASIIQYNAISAGKNQLQLAFFQAVQTAIELLGNVDPQIRLAAAKLVMGYAIGTPPRQKPVEGETIQNIKGFHVDANPDIWDEEIAKREGELENRNIVDGEVVNVHSDKNTG